MAHFEPELFKTYSLYNIIIMREREGEREINKREIKEGYLKYILKIIILVNYMLSK